MTARVNTYFNVRDWTKNPRKPEECCEIIAINRTFKDKIERLNYILMTKVVIAEKWPARSSGLAIDHGYSIAKFNDHINTTFEDIVWLNEEVERRLNA